MATKQRNTRGEFKSSKRHIAAIMTSSVEVVCPACGEPQPNPDDGSHLWLPAQVAAAEGKRECVACESNLLIIPRMTAKVA